VSGSKIPTSSPAFRIPSIAAIIASVDPHVTQTSVSGSTAIA